MASIEKKLVDRVRNTIDFENSINQKIVKEREEMSNIIKNLDLKQISALEIVENKSFKSPLARTK